MATLTTGNNVGTVVQYHRHHQISWHHVSQLMGTTLFFLQQSVMLVDCSPAHVTSGTYCGRQATVQRLRFVPCSPSSTLQ